MNVVSFFIFSLSASDVHLLVRCLLVHYAKKYVALFYKVKLIISHIFYNVKKNFLLCFIPYHKGTRFILKVHFSHLQTLKEWALVMVF